MDQLLHGVLRIHESLVVEDAERGIRSLTGNEDHTDGQDRSDDERAGCGLVHGNLLVGVVL